MTNFPTLLTMVAMMIAVAAANATSHASPDQSSVVKICADATKVADAPPPAGIQPATAGCDSSKLFYQKDPQATPEQVWACVLSPGQIERLPADALRMMLFANGRGVPKNTAMAMKLACSLQDVPESEREAAIQALHAQAPGATFDWCDHVITTPSTAVCAGIQAELNIDTYKKRINELKPKDPRLHGAWEDMLKATTEFIDARSGEEIDLSGTGRAIFVMNETDIQWRDFIDTLEKLSSKKARKYSAADLKDRNQRMTSELKRIGAHKGDWGTVTPAQILETQKKWETWRTTLSAFAAKAWQSDAVALQAWMTIKRINMLKNFRTN